RSDHAAPLGPRAVVVLHVLVAEQLLQHEPGVRRALADAAVGDDLFVGRDALAAVELPQLIGRLERPILVGRLAPGDVLRTWNVPAALRGLGEAGRGDDLAVVLGRRADVDQGLARRRTDVRPDFRHQRAVGRVQIPGLVAGRLDLSFIGRQRAAFLLPLL